MPHSTSSPNDSLLAQSASQVGNTLQNNPNSEALNDLARSSALSAANAKAGQEISDWLNGKGKVRVKLDADRDFSVKNSQLDLLVPLWESESHMISLRVQFIARTTVPSRISAWVIAILPIAMRWVQIHSMTTTGRAVTRAWGWVLNISATSLSWRRMAIYACRIGKTLLTLTIMKSARPMAGIFVQKVTYHLTPALALNWPTNNTMAIMSGYLVKIISRKILMRLLLVETIHRSHC
ncbi:hypothetical protein B4900_13310 [Yersinia rohdei]|nr:hypothetical protein B4900_13310 [Yersinia rohdei]